MGLIIDELMVMTDRWMMMRPAQVPSNALTIIITITISTVISRSRRTHDDP